MNNPKKIIKIIGIVVFIICIICVILLYMLNKENSNTSIEEQPLEGDTLNINYSVQKLRDPTTFFTIQNYIQKDFNENFIAKEMNVLSGDRIDSYSVYGEVADENSGNIQDMCFIFRIDIENLTFKIEKLNNDYDNVNEINLENGIPLADFLTEREALYENYNRKSS